MTRRCKGLNRQGEPCGAAPLKDSDYCRAHDPDLPPEEAFGTPEQAARAGAAEKPRVPKLREAMAILVEERAEEILMPYFDALQAVRLVAVRIGEGTDEIIEAPDHGTRLAAAKGLHDRANGKTGTAA